MDEQQISAQVANNIPKDEPTPEPVNQSPDKLEPGDIGYVDNLGAMDDFTRMKMQDYMGIQLPARKDAETNEKLDFVYQWAADVAGSNDYIVIVNYLNDVHSRMGYTVVKSKIDQLYEYAKLDKTRRRIEEEMQYV